LFGRHPFLHLNDDWMSHRVRNGEVRNVAVDRQFWGWVVDAGNRYDRVIFSKLGEDSWVRGLTKLVLVSKLHMVDEANYGREYRRIGGSYGPQYGPVGYGGIHQRKLGPLRDWNEKLQGGPIREIRSFYPSWYPSAEEKVPGASKGWDEAAQDVSDFFGFEVFFHASGGIFLYGTGVGNHMISAPTFLHVKRVPLFTS
jgi:hypothetical protein